MNNQFGAFADVVMVRDHGDHHIVRIDIGFVGRARVDCVDGDVLHAAIRTLNGPAPLDRPE